jgi:hypothetical protein
MAKTNFTKQDLLKRGHLHGKGSYSLKRRDSAEPVVGSGSAAELEQALAKGMARGDHRR